MRGRIGPHRHGARERLSRNLSRRHAPRADRGSCALAAGEKDRLGTVKDGRFVDNAYDAASVRPHIESTRADWGVDTKKFGPEIDAVLYGVLGVPEIDLWRRESELRDAPPTPNRSAVAKAKAVLTMIRDKSASTDLVDVVLDRRSMPADEQKELISLLEAFQEGEKFNLKSGQRITLDSKNVPLGGLYYARARLAASQFGQVEIERGSNGYKMHVRKGGDVKANVEGGLFFSKSLDVGGANAKIQLNASLGLEGTGGFATGFSFAYPGTPAGRNNLVRIVAKMVGGGQISSRDFEHTSDISKSSEIVATAAIGAGLGLDVSLTGKTPSASTSPDKQGAGLTTAAGAAVGVKSKWTEASNLNEAMTKGEVEVSGTASASLSIYAKLWNPFNVATGAAASRDGMANNVLDAPAITKDSTGASLYNVSEGGQSDDLVGATASIQATWTKKWKHVRNAYGYFTKGEMIRQTNITFGKRGPFAGFASVALPSLEAAMTDLPDDSPALTKYRTTLRDNLSVVASHMAGEDVLAATYAATPDAIKIANALLTRGRNARRTGDKRAAHALEQRARSIMDNDANYAPAKVTLVKTSGVKSETGNINARWIKWDSYTEGKLETPRLLLSIAPPPT
jgi:hypothetical protein